MRHFNLRAERKNPPGALHRQPAPFCNHSRLASQSFFLYFTYIRMGVKFGILTTWRNGQSLLASCWLQRIISSLICWSRWKPDGNYKASTDLGCVGDVSGILKRRYQVAWQDERQHTISSFSFWHYYLMAVYVNKSNRVMSDGGESRPLRRWHRSVTKMLRCRSCIAKS